MNPNEITINQPQYNKLVDNIGSLLAQARQKAYSAVNEVLVKTYWQIGKDIIEYEQKGKEKAEYGSSLLANLSIDLSLKHGKGFSERNLERMRKFFLLFPISTTVSSESQKTQTVSTQSPQKSQIVSGQFSLSWSHYCELMKVKEDLARSFYEKQCIKENWSVRELIRQKNSMLFERIALSKDVNGVLELAEKGQIIEKPEDAIKDPYILEFLNLEESPSYSESDVESSIISKLKEFILEMGRDFLFVDRQRRITIANRHYHIDLVFYHRILKCFVLVDVKAGELTHADTGQMDFYLNYYKQEEVREGENEPIGLILCASKNHEFAKYVLTNKNLFASEYKLKLPSEKLLQEKIKEIIK